jgi:hypothetical protein
MGLPQDPFYLFHSPIAVPFRLSCFVGLRMGGDAVESSGPSRSRQYGSA